VLLSRAFHSGTGQRLGLLLAHSSRSDLLIGGATSLLQNGLSKKKGRVLGGSDIRHDSFVEVDVRMHGRSLFLRLFDHLLVDRGASGELLGPSALVDKGIAFQLTE